jgi:hypothetical protein
MDWFVKFKGKSENRKPSIFPLDMRLSGFNFPLNRSIGKLVNIVPIPMVYDTLYLYSWDLEAYITKYGTSQCGLPHMSGKYLMHNYSMNVYIYKSLTLI